LRKRIIVVAAFLVLVLATSAQALNLMDLVLPQDIDLNNISPISSVVAPIPGSLVLLGSGLVGLFSLRKFTKR